MQQFAVIGIGRFGYSVAKTLGSLGCEVLAIDSNESCVQDIGEHVTQAVQLDSTDKKAMLAVGMEDTDIAVVAIGVNKEASIMTTLLLKEMGVKTVLAKAITRTHAKVLKKIGADRVIFPEGDMGARIAKSLVTPNILDTLELSREYGIVEIISPGKFVGQTLSRLNIRANFGLNVIAVKHRISSLEEKNELSKSEITVSPMADYQIPPESVLVMVGSNEDIDNLRKKIDRWEKE
ncbi:MAG: NAD-binding protein [bacterium]